MKKKLIIIGIFLVLIVGLGIFFYHQSTFTKKTVEKNYYGWNVLRYQNDIETGEYLGFLYDSNYNLSTLPKRYVLYLLVNYYISYEEDFFDDYNQIEDSLYQKEVSTNQFNQKLKELFGPDYSPIDFEDATYNCGRSITKKDNDTYIIQSIHPEVCGAFDDTKDKYLNHIRNYKKEKDQIIVYMQVAYSSPNQNGGVTLYSDKTKQTVLEKDYSYSCYSGEDKSCFKNFEIYKVILKKASDGNYYFYAIEKGN